MKYGIVKVICDNCKKEIIIEDTIIKKEEIKKKIRTKKWIVTRKENCYCEECAKKLRLRNSGVSKK